MSSSSNSTGIREETGDQDQDSPSPNLHQFSYQQHSPPSHSFSFDFSSSSRSSSRASSSHHHHYSNPPLASMPTSTSSSSQQTFYTSSPIIPQTSSVLDYDSLLGPAPSSSSSSSSSSTAGLNGNGNGNGDHGGRSASAAGSSSAGGISNSSSLRDGLSSISTSGLVSPLSPLVEPFSPSLGTSSAAAGGGGLWGTGGSTQQKVQAQNDYRSGAGGYASNSTLPTTTIPFPSLSTPESLNSYSSISSTRGGLFSAPLPPSYYSEDGYGGGSSNMIQSNSSNGGPTGLGFSTSRSTIVGRSLNSLSSSGVLPPSVTTAVGGVVEEEISTIFVVGFPEVSSLSLSLPYNQSPRKCHLNLPLSTLIGYARKRVPKHVPLLLRFRSCHSQDPFLILDLDFNDSQRERTSDSRSFKVRCCPSTSSPSPRLLFSSTRRNFYGQWWRRLRRCFWELPS